MPRTLLSNWGNFFFFFLMKRYKAYYNAFKELAVLKEKWIKPVIFIGKIRNHFIHSVLPGAAWAILSTFVCLPTFRVHVKLQFCSLNWRFLWGATPHVKLYVVYIRASFQTVLWTISHLNHDGNIGDVETYLKIFYNYIILIRTRKDTAGISLYIRDFLILNIVIFSDT